MHAKQRVLTAWHDVYIHSVMKRFQMARAQALFRNQLEQRALLCWQSYAKAQAHKASMQNAAVKFLWCAMQVSFFAQCRLCICACVRWRMTTFASSRIQVLSRADALCSAYFDCAVSSARHLEHLASYATRARFSNMPITAKLCLCIAYSLACCTPSPGSQ